MIQPFGRKAAQFIRRPASKDALINILNGAIRSSKTWAVNAKVLSLLAAGFWPGGTGLITGNSKTSIKTNVLNDLFAWVGDKRYKYNSQSGELILCGRPFLVCGAKDESSWKSIRGATVGLWIGDEVTLYPKSFFEMAVSRLSLADSRMYGTTNPATPYHYLKTEWIDNPDKIARGEVWSETFTLEDNPNIDEAKKEQFRRMFAGVFYQRNILGLWVIAEGAIYRDVVGPENFYNDSTRPAQLLSRGGHVRRWVPCDFGTVNALCMLDVYDDGTTLWIEDELYWDSRKENRQKTNGEYAEDFMARFATGDSRLWPSVIIDPSAASFRLELVRRGVMVSDADNDVLEGIRKVASLLSRRLIRVHERCRNLRRELETYAWDNKRADNGVEQPIKENDHACDALRYLVATEVNEWRIAA